MDETLVLCAVDLSGRPYLVFDGEFTTDRVGYMDTEMVKEFSMPFLIPQDESAYQGAFRRKQPPYDRGDVQGFCKGTGSGNGH